MALFGVCAAPDKAPAIARAGYDFIECPVSTALAIGEGEEALARNCDLITGAGLTAEAFNCFLPGELKIVGSEVDLPAIADYAAGVLERAHRLGGSIMVFGSGGARGVPQGFSCQRAREQVDQFLETVGAIAAKEDMVIVIEPLCAEACNMINTVRQATEIAQRLHLENVKVLADYFHMGVDGEPLDNLSVAGELLRHVHLADPVGRVAPGEGPTDITAFFSAIKAVGYDGRISLECRWTDFEDELPKVLTRLKDTWTNA